MGVNACCGPRWKHGPHETPKYGSETYKFEVDYYKKTYCSQEKLACIPKKLENWVKK